MAHPTPADFLLPLGRKKAGIEQRCGCVIQACPSGIDSGSTTWGRPSRLASRPPRSSFTATAVYNSTEPSGPATSNTSASPSGPDSAQSSASHRRATPDLACGCRLDSKRRRRTSRKSFDSLAHPLFVSEIPVLGTSERVAAAKPPALGQSDFLGPAELAKLILGRADLAEPSWTGHTRSDSRNGLQAQVSDPPSDGPHAIPRPGPFLGPAELAKLILGRADMAEPSRTGHTRSDSRTAPRTALGSTHGQGNPYRPDSRTAPHAGQSLASYTVEGTLTSFSSFTRRAQAMAHVEELWPLEVGLQAKAEAKHWRATSPARALIPGSDIRLTPSHALALSHEFGRSAFAPSSNGPTRLQGRADVQEFRVSHCSDAIGGDCRALTCHGHTTLNIPDPVRSRKSSRVGPD